VPRPALLRPALLLASLLLPSVARAQAPTALARDIDARAAQLEPRVVAWRRDLHQHPELSNRETRTAGVVAAHLKSLGIEVTTGVAKTGVVGILKGGRPGPVVALRADMDALPVAEETSLPFKSTVRGTFGGQDVGVMHACGHDLHVATLMGVAEILAGMKDRLPGTVKFVFQPAEEGAPPGETGGAGLMIREGVLENPRVDAIFGLHVFSTLPTGEVHVKTGGIMASSDTWRMVIRGRQTHGALPWNGVDPIVVASQIVLGLQTIVSRQVELVKTPAIVTVGSMHGGVRFNIIPDSVTLDGTVRSFDNTVRADILKRMERTAKSIAEASGATATMSIAGAGNPVTDNHVALTEQMLPTLRRVVGANMVKNATPTTTAEDYAQYQEKVPGIFFFLGAAPRGTDAASAAPNHSPRFVADESVLVPGMKLLANLAVDFLSGGGLKSADR
jgi:amidohydrolase